MAPVGSSIPKQAQHMSKAGPWVSDTCPMRDGFSIDPLRNDILLSVAHWMIFKDQLIEANSDENNNLIFSYSDNADVGIIMLK